MFRIIEKWFAKRADAKDTEARILIEKENAREVTAYNQLAIATNQMLNTNCAINDNKHCYPGCTHFQKGDVHSWRMFMEEELIIDVRTPRCRLWK